MRGLMGSPDATMLLELISLLDVYSPESLVKVWSLILSSEEQNGILIVIHSYETFD
jgi:ABC-type molybdenum transport system ATPase subunit/photorepair protein PhrA